MGAKLHGSVELAPSETTFLEWKVQVQLKILDLEKTEDFVIFISRLPTRSSVPVSPSCNIIQNVLSSHSLVTFWIILLQLKLDVIRIDFRDCVPTGTWSEIMFPLIYHSLLKSSNCLTPEILRTLAFSAMLTSKQTHSLFLGIFGN